MNDALVIEVVRKTVTVDCAVEEAFRIFTKDAMSWWPVASHSIHGTVSEIVFEPRVGGEVYEVVDRASAATGRPCSSGSRRAGSSSPGTSSTSVTSPRSRCGSSPQTGGRGVELEHRGVGER